MKELYSKELFGFENYHIDAINRITFNLKEPEIKKAIFNKPATIVYWQDGTKTVVKCQDNDTYDKEKGLAIAVMKKIYGNKGNYNEVLKKWIKD